MLLRRATLADGQVVDVRVCGDTIHDLASHDLASHGLTSMAVQPGEQVVDLGGHLLLPAPAEPHAHLDKAFLAERLPNPTGDLLGAITAMQLARHELTVADTAERAERAARLMLSNGTTAVRTHADVTQAGGLTSVEALVDVRDRLADLMHIEIVALTGWPAIGPEGAEQRALLRDAIDAGADVVGGAPHLETDPAAANAQFLEIAAEAGLPVDLHVDESLDPAALGLEDLARRVLDSGFPHAVTASHCVSLSTLCAARQQEIAELVAAAGISVVALPHTNLFLQARGVHTAPARALAPVKTLWRAGVNVCAGADNLQDPFNPMGRGDALETAMLLVLTAHALPDEAYSSVSRAARLAMGLVPNDIAPGRRADLLAVRATTVREAMAMMPSPRWVLSGGRVVGGETER